MLTVPVDMPKGRGGRGEVEGRSRVRVGVRGISVIGQPVVSKPTCIFKYHSQLYQRTTIFNRHLSRYRNGESREAARPDGLFKNPSDGIAGRGAVDYFIKSSAIYMSRRLNVTVLMRDATDFPKFTSAMLTWGFVPRYETYAKILNDS